MANQTVAQIVEDIRYSTLSVPAGEALYLDTDLDVVTSKTHPQGALCVITAEEVEEANASEIEVAIQDWLAQKFDAELAACDDLDDLLSLLRSASEIGSEWVGKNIADLPTFGGDAPSDTRGIFSWDETRELVQGSQGWELAARG